MAEGGEGGYAVNGGIFCFIFLYCLSKHSKHYFTYINNTSNLKKFFISPTTFHNSFSLRNSLNFYRLPKTKNTLKAQKLKKWLTLSSFNHTKIIRKNVDCTVVDTLLFWESDAITK